MTLRAEAVLDDYRRMVILSYFDWEAPVGRIQRGECDGYQAPANWPFNLVPHRMTPEPFVNQVARAAVQWEAGISSTPLDEQRQPITWGSWAAVQKARRERGCE